jgi:hypothetical protein
MVSTAGGRKRFWLHIDMSAMANMALLIVMHFVFAICTATTALAQLQLGPAFEQS